MTCSIFVKSCRKDRFFLQYLLRSLAKFATGFVETVLLIPEMDRPHFELTDFGNASVRWVDEPDGQNYLRQQAFKMHADEYCSGELILAIDSDCFFFKSISPEMFQSNGKAISLIRHWADAGTSIAWKPITEKFLKWEMAFDGMACLPFIIDRRVLPLIRQYSQDTHGKSIDEYILSCPGNDFSEFNALSAFSLRFTPFFYDWRIANPEADGFPRNHWQKWSWSEEGVIPFEEEYKAILAK